jgi:hypothetical protein
MARLTGTSPSRSRSSELALAISQAGIDLTLAHGGLRETLRAAIAQHGGVIDWTVDHTGWVVTLYLPDERVFCGGTLEDGLLACLAWLVASESPAALARG